MSVSSVGAKSAVSVQRIVEMSRQLDELRRQLGTGKTSTNYAGLGIDRGLTVSLRTQLNAIASFDQSIAAVSTRLQIAQTTLTRLDESNHTVKAAAVSSAYVINQQGRTTDQFTAMNELDQMLALLNTRVGDTYIYSGKAADTPAVASLDHILHGDGARRGLDFITEERRQADGCDGLGRLTVSPVASTGALVQGAGATLTAVPDLITQGAVSQGQTLGIKIGDNPQLTITFGTGANEVQTLADLGARLATLTGGTATVDATGNLTISAMDPITVTDPDGVAGNFGLSTLTDDPLHTMTIAQPLADGVFGLRLHSVTENLTGTTVTGPAGVPPSIAIDMTRNPSPDEKISLVVRLPDGSTERLELVATTASPAAEGQFTIGADSSITAANLQAAITGGLGTMARTSLVAASALTASKSYFYDNPPKRVDGVPPDTATALTNATAADTMFWYTGENDGSPARSTAFGRIDQSITVSYGMRANEQGIANTVATIAAYALMTFSESDVDGNERYRALTQRVTLALDGAQGEQKIMNIEAEIAGAQTAMKGATDRHQQTAGTLEDLLQTITVAPIEEVSAKILTLQVRLQASLQTTALLAQTSLVNFL